jgi:hypothetical protein
MAAVAVVVTLVTVELAAEVALIELSQIVEV